MCAASWAPSSCRAFFSYNKSFIAAVCLSTLLLLHTPVGSLLLFASSHISQRCAQVLLRAKLHRLNYCIYRTIYKLHQFRHICARLYTENRANHRRWRPSHSKFALPLPLIARDSVLIEPANSLFIFYLLSCFLLTMVVALKVLESAQCYVQISCVKKLHFASCVHVSKNYFKLANICAFEKTFRVLEATCALVFSLTFCLLWTIWFLIANVVLSICRNVSVQHMWQR